MSAGCNNGILMSFIAPRTKRHSPSPCATDENQPLPSDNNDENAPILKTPEANRTKNLKQGSLTPVRSLAKSLEAAAGKPYFFAYRKALALLKRFDICSDFSKLCCKDVRLY